MGSLRTALAFAALVPMSAQAAPAQEGYLEFQTVRFTNSTITERGTTTAGVARERISKINKLTTFPPWLSVVGRFGDFAFQLTRTFGRSENGYLAFGYLFSDAFEAGLGANMFVLTNDITEAGVKSGPGTRFFFGGPYVRWFVPLDFARLEVRGEGDWGVSVGTNKTNTGEVKTEDASGFEADLDVRLVFPASRRLDFATGFNVFFRSVKDKAPSVTDNNGQPVFRDTATTDFTLGLNLLNARFHF